MKVTKYAAYKICMGIGKQLRKKQNYDVARTWYTRALHLNPRCSLALAERGETFRREGRFAEAVNDLSEAMTPGAIIASAVLQVPSCNFTSTHVQTIVEHINRVNMTLVYATLQATTRETSVPAPVPDGSRVITTAGPMDHP
jgi:lipopolysaccharide biosynthesis regulator YciM